MNIDSKITGVMPVMFLAFFKVKTRSRKEEKDGCIWIIADGMFGEIFSNIKSNTMSVIKFGTRQINNPTPAGINLAVRVFTITAGIFLGFIQTSNLFGPSTQNVISSILGLLLALVNGLAPLFGVDTTQQVIPRQKVAAMNVN